MKMKRFFVVIKGNEDEAKFAASLRKATFEPLNYWKEWDQTSGYLDIDEFRTRVVYDWYNYTNPAAGSIADKGELLLFNETTN
jgi:hypothetical protein